MRVALVGARADGHAGVVLDTLAEGRSHEVVGFLDETPSLWGTEVHGIPVLGGLDAIREAIDRGGEGAILSIGDPGARERLGRPCGRPRSA